MCGNINIVNVYIYIYSHPAVGTWNVRYKGESAILDPTPITLEIYNMDTKNDGLAELISLAAETW